MEQPVVVICLESPHEFWRFSDRHASLLRTSFPAMQFHVATTEDVHEHLADARIYFGWRFPEDWFGYATGLEWIASPAAGIDHLPVGQAAAAGITVTRGHGYHGPPITEHALGMILGFSRGLLASSRFQRTRRWWKDDLATEFFDLAGATLTIVGCGSIGTHLAKAANALGMRVIGVRRNPPKESAESITWIPSGRAAEAVAAADVIVDLLPADDSTRHFFDHALLASAKAGAVFLNLGRGSTVDHDALLHQLDAGRLRGAALDVTEPRPLPMDHPLRTHPRVLLTPKSATFSHRYMDEAVSFFTENLRRYTCGLPLNGVAAHPHASTGDRR